MNVEGYAQNILAGELVVFPTETVYGLGALASNDTAVDKVFEVKGRPSHNPMILHIANKEMLTELVQEIPYSAQKLIENFWPGPLTICLNKSDKVSDLVTADLPTVCVRCPSHQTAHELLKFVGEAVAAPSANLSGKPSTTTFADAKQQLEQKGVYFLDGGETPLGLESTVVDCSGDNVKILRPGSITKEEIEKVFAQKVVEEKAGRISSPGQLLSHYSPSGELIVLYGKKDKRRQWIAEKIILSDSNYAFGLVGEIDDSFANVKKMVLSKKEDDLTSYANKLYQFLNWCDRMNATHIVLELPDVKAQLLDTLINRLEKASDGNIVRF